MGISFSVSGLAAQSYGEAIKHFKESLIEDVADMNGACGSHIRVQYDGKAEPKKVEELGGSSKCGSIADSLKILCGDPEWKTTIAYQIKTLDCQYIKGANPSGRDFTLKNNKLHVSFDKDSEIAPGKTTWWLKKKLAPVDQDRAAAVKGEDELANKACEPFRTELARLARSSPSEGHGAIGNLETISKALKRPQSVSQADWDHCHVLFDQQLKRYGERAKAAGK